ncbi:MAG: BatA domain-containing protein, partial [bacterium]|nr:BatA domain-containing protein [bacterium]
MGMLAPLYALAALAVVGPIVFHLIRRQPQGQQKFSSLMFLRPSPPKLTRRSRLDHWLLLALRMIALALIAFAFARPYFRERSLLDIDLSGRNVVLLLDTSASMRRPDVWQKAQEAIQQVIDSLANNDHLSLYAIDDSLRPIVAVEDSYRMEAQTAQQAVRTAAADLEPSWQSTELAAGLTGLADTLNAATVSGPLSPGMTSEIVLVTDLHTNSGIEPLQGYPWPENVQLDVRRIQPETPGNARPSWMPQADDADDDRIRIRIENNQQSEQQTFQLAWANADGIEEGGATRVQVPAGQVRVVPMAGNSRGSDRIRLIGDAWEADNDVIMVRTEPLRQTILYVGRSEAEAEDDPAYFLTKAPINSSDVERQIVFLEENDLPTALEDSQVAAVIIEPGFGLAQHAQRLRQFVASGGTVMVNLARPLATEALQEETTAFLR